MGLRPGYKRTEVGVIPEEWSTSTVAGASDAIMDFRGRTPKKLAMDWGGGEIPALSARNVKAGYIDFTEECYLGSEELYGKWMTHGDVEKGDIVFTTEAPLGNVAAIPDDRRYILSQRTVLFKPKRGYIHGPFMLHVLSSAQFQKLLTDNSSGSTAQGIQRRRLERLPIPAPSLKEQRAIATALSDVDALLTQLDRLIAKKRDIKQAAMQQLLTGKTRLPGFGEEWEPCAFDEVLERLNVKAHQLQTADYQTVGRYPVVDQGQQPVVGYSDDSKRRFLCPSGGVVVFGDHTCVVKFVDFDFLVGADGTQVLQARPGHSTRFLAYELQREGIQQTGYNRHFKFLKDRRFKMPHLAEQTAIATLLSDLDAELAALEARRDKTRALKQGMMQELLTGRTRLI